MQDHLSLTFAALADPTRRAMLARLSRGEANVSDLGKPFLKKMSRPAITKHLKVLEKAGLITKGREANGGPVNSMGTLSRTWRTGWNCIAAYWEESFDRLDDYLKSVTKKKHMKGTENDLKK